MPLYKYECLKCGNKFEELIAADRADEPQKCPECGEENSRRLLSIFAALTGNASSSGYNTGGCGGGFT